MGDNRARDELIATVLSVVESLPQQRKATLLLEHALTLIHSGRYDHGVKALLDMYLRTPVLPEGDRARTLCGCCSCAPSSAGLSFVGQSIKSLTRGMGALVSADFGNALSADPLNREAQA